MKCLKPVHEPALHNTDLVAYNVLLNMSGDTSLTNLILRLYLLTFNI